MTILSSKYQKWTAVLGLLFLITYFFEDFLYNKFWVSYVIPFLIFAGSFLIVFFIGLWKRDRGVIKVLISVLVIIGVTELFKSEIFKSKILLTADLKDDLSNINLILRKNHTFEIRSTTIFSEKRFAGKYKIDNNKIIFLTRHYDSDFIPDTLTIYQKKLILKFNKGEPVLDYATYFDIKQNRLTEEL